MERRKSLTPEKMARLRLGSDLNPDRRAMVQTRTTERVAERTRTARRGRLFKVVLVALAALLLWRLFTPIQHVRINAPDQPLAEQALQNALDATYRQNILINTDLIASQVTAAIPDAVSAKVEHNLLLSSLTVNVTIQKEAIRWQTGGVQYLLSDYGIALAMPTEPNQSLPLVLDDSDVAINLKEQVVPRDFVQFVLELKGEATQRQIAVQELRVLGSTRELRTVIEDRGYFVIFSTKRAAAEQLDELTRLEGYFASVGRRASQYVDLRIPGRAYWQ